MRQVMLFHRVIGELNGVIRLEPFLDVRQHAFIVVRGDVQCRAVHFRADFALLDDDAARLEDEARQLEHRALIGGRRVNGHVRIGADAEMTFVR